MKIAFINGSPKLKESASGNILEEFKTLVKKNNVIVNINLHKPQINDKQKDELYSCDTFIFAYPLYVDGIPSHLLYCLKELQEYFITKISKPIRVYAIVNCGFFEGSQNAISIDILKNWSHRAGLLWGQGIGIGGGGMLSFMKNVPLGHGPKKNLGKALNEFANNIIHEKSENSIFISPNFPKFAYKYAAHNGWRLQVKTNGLTAKDLFRQL